MEDVLKRRLQGENDQKDSRLAAAASVVSEM